VVEAPVASSLTPLVTEGQWADDPPPKRRRALRILGALAAGVVALLALTAAAAFVLSVRVDGGSMLPTLRTGERLLPQPGSGDAVERFEVVLLQRPGRPETLVKRVIALPGDRVEIVSTPADPYQVLVQPGGSGLWYRVRVDGWASQAHRSSSCCGPDGTRSDGPRVQTVPPGAFFFLGDDPDGSYDSRAYGWGRIDLVTARVWLRLWPFAGPSALARGARLEPVRVPAVTSTR
jgi:signal peptidase I